MTVWTDGGGCTPTVVNIGDIVRPVVAVASAGTLDIVGCSILPTLTGVPTGMSALLPPPRCLSSIAATPGPSIVLTSSALRRRAAAICSPKVVGNPNGPISGLLGPISRYIPDSEWWGGGMVTYFHYSFNGFSILPPFLLLSCSVLAVCLAR